MKFRVQGGGGDERKAASKGRPVRRELLKEIEREQAKHRLRCGKFNFPFLNNFPGLLPGGFYRLILEAEDLHIPYDNPAAGPKRRGLTPAQMFELIDRLIPEVGLDVETIKCLQRTRTGKIYDYVYPLYLRLREEGFMHYPDLTA